MINPLDKRGAYVDGHQRTHLTEPLAQWETGEICFANQGKLLIKYISPLLFIPFGSKLETTIVQNYEHQTRCPILPFVPSGLVRVISTSVNQSVWSVPNVILVGLLLDVGSGK